MRTLMHRSKWTAAVIGAAALVTWLFPAVATALTLALYSSWVVIAVLLLRTVRAPAALATALPAALGLVQRAAVAAVRVGTSARVRVWLAPRVRSLPPGARLIPNRWR